MQPTLNVNGGTKSDIVYINKFAKINYGDIVVLEKNVSVDSNHIIKRVIGLAGDTIEIKQAEDLNIYVYRNGEQLTEDYIYNIKTSGDPNNLGMQTTLNNFIQFRHMVLSNPDNFNAVFDNNGRLVLQADQVFVLGDCDLRHLH
jgi:signal peptidase I